MFVLAMFQESTISVISLFLSLSNPIPVLFKSEKAAGCEKNVFLIFDDK